MKRLLTRIRRGFDGVRSGSRGLILLTLSVGWFFTVGVRLIYPVLVPQIRDAFAVNNTLAGALFTAILVTYAAGQFPSGLVADRIGERFILTLSVAGSILGITLLVVAPAFGVLLLGCLLFGAGSGLFASPTLSVTSKVYSERTGTVHGILFAASSVGTTVLPIVAGFIALRYGWRAGFAFVLPVFVPIAIGVRLLVPQTESRGSVTLRAFTDTARSVVVSVRRQETLLVTAALLLVVVTYQALSSFLPTYLIEAKNLSQGTATLVFGLFFGVGFLAQIAAGTLADRWSQRMIMFALAGISAVSVFALTFTDGFVPIVVLSGLMSTASAYISVTNTYLVSVFPDDVQGGGVGLVRSVVIGVGATSPIVIGSFADAGLFDLSFRLLAGCLILSVVILSYSLLTSDQSTAAAA